MSKLQDVLARLYLARATYKEVEAEHTEAKNQAVDEFKASDQKKVETVVGDRLVKGTLVEGSQVVRDDAALLEKLTKKQRDAVTKLVIDNDKLEAAVKVGLIDVETVASHSEVVPKAPYILVKDEPNIAPTTTVRKKRPTKRAAGRK